MKRFSVVVVSLAALGGLAYAQATKGSGSATVGAGATVKTGATAGSAAAGAKAAGGAATGAAGSAAAGAKVGAGATATATTGAAMEMPKPPAEIAAAAKMMSKTLNCTGTGLGMDMKTEEKMKSTMSAKSDFNGWWIRQTIKGTVGTGKTAQKMQMEGFMTYDAKLAKWRFQGVSNDGGSLIGTADMKDGKYELVGDMMTPMGSAQFKDHGDMTDKKNIHFWGEFSMDKGKTWTKVYDSTCK